MFRMSILAICVAMIGICVAESAVAADKTVRLGRVYYRMVCTSCHKDTAGETISPSSRTKAEWEAYLGADAHDASGKSNPKVSYYTSTAFRDSVKDTNKAAKKFLKMPEDQLQDALNAFIAFGAKDSDNPQRCK